MPIQANDAMIQKTYQQVAEFDGEARRWLARFPANTKFRYAIERVLKRARDVLQRYREKVDELSIQNAAVDKDGILLTDERGQFRFTPEGLTKRNREQLAFLRSETEIEPYIATEPPKELSAADADLFMDFVLKERPPEPAEPEPAVAPVVLPPPKK